MTHKFLTNSGVLEFCSGCVPFQGFQKKHLGQNNACNIKGYTIDSPCATSQLSYLIVPNRR
jgi:hypothetical protein